MRQPTFYRIDVAILDPIPTDEGLTLHIQLAATDKRRAIKTALRYFDPKYQPLCIGAGIARATPASNRNAAASTDSLFSANPTS